LVLVWLLIARRLPSVSAAAGRPRPRYLGNTFRLAAAAGLR
jgi:hypothetical protein